MKKRKIKFSGLFLPKVLRNTVFWENLMQPRKEYPDQPATGKATIKQWIILVTILITVLGGDIYSRLDPDRLWDSFLGQLIFTLGIGIPLYLLFYIYARFFVGRK